MNRPPDLVLLGNLLVDDIVFPDGRTHMAQAGGAMLYASLAAARFGTRCGCVSIRGDDYPAKALEELRSRGVLLDGVHDLGANGVRTWLLYEGTIRRVIHRLGCPSHEAVSPNPEHVPEGWRRARAFHLAPMPIATQRALVRAIRGWELPEQPAFICLDPHVPLDLETFAEWRALLADVDLFLPSDDEMRWPEATDDAGKAFAGLATGRLRYIAWKRGVAGGVFFDARAEKVQRWRPGAANVVDPTGAGDAFAAGFVSAWLEGQPAAAALERAVGSADRVISAWGPEALFTDAPAAPEGLRATARAAARAARAAVRRTPGAA